MSNIHSKHNIFFFECLLVLFGEPSKLRKSRAPRLSLFGLDCVLLLSGSGGVECTKGGLGRVLDSLVPMNVSYSLRPVTAAPALSMDHTISLRTVPSRSLQSPCATHRGGVARLAPRGYVDDHRLPRQGRCGRACSQRERQASLRTSYEWKTLGGS